MNTQETAMDLNLNIPEKIQEIYLIAICGMGMGSLAGLLKSQGYAVSGSDLQSYPPMGDFLAKNKIPVLKGYQKENIQNPDLIIVGNAAFRDNPEVLRAKELGIPVTSMAKALHYFFLRHKKNLVISGTHGKTTTTSLISHLLTELQQDPSYFIGGLAHNFTEPFRYQKTGDYFVIEGDEYDTAFFDKKPKFYHYAPFGLLITSLEFDHADIFKDITDIQRHFVNLIEQKNLNGPLVCFYDDPAIRQVIQKTNSSNIITYGLNKKADFVLSKFQQIKEFFCWKLESKNEIYLFKSLQTGIHNALNTSGAFLLLKELGFDPNDIINHLASFKGVRRRQDILLQTEKLIFVDDFAHHPTAVFKTLDGLKKRYPDYTLWAIFEPRSNTSMRNIFQQQYPLAFAPADKIVLAAVSQPKKIQEELRLNPQKIIKQLKNQQKTCWYLETSDKICALLEKEIKPYEKNLVCFMSNGSFDNLPKKACQIFRLDQ